MFNEAQDGAERISSEETIHATTGIGDEDQIREIPLVAIAALRDQLRKLSSSWAEKLADKMDVDITKIYNIVNNKVQGNQWRVDFLLQGTALRDELMVSQNKAAEIASELIANP